MKKPIRMLYDCSKCPAWCCTYPNIFVTQRDIERIAKHLKMDVEDAKSKFTRMSKDYDKPIMRHKKDKYFDTACRFLDQKTRRCTIYEARPHGCRTYPGGRCGYWEFLKIERDRQEEPDATVTTDHRA